MTSKAHLRQTPEPGLTNCTPSEEILNLLCLSQTCSSSSSNYGMPVPRIAQYILGVSLFLVLSIILLHPSSTVSVPYSDFWRSGPQYIPPAIYDSDNRHLTSAQCHERYPGLFYEADLARDFHKSKGGISESTVDAADQDGASARLAIIDNKVGLTFGGMRTKAHDIAICQGLPWWS
jgi:hypothetical protein